MEFHDIDKKFIGVYNELNVVVFHESVWGLDMIISFVGHSVISSSGIVKEMVKEQLRNIIGQEKAFCYLGGYGDFDRLCACACRELKQERVFIELVYVTPYISLSEQEKIKSMQKVGLYDSSVYPPIENVPLRFAVLKRNEWMMSNADIVIAYVNRNYGGAYKSLLIARRKQKKIINICDIL